MNIALLSGAYKNAGDFLITSRAKRILEENIPNANVRVFLRKELRQNLIAINQCDVVVISGGPVFMSNIVSMFDIDITREVIPPS